MGRRRKPPVEVVRLDARAIGGRIRTARKALGWKLADLARVAGLARGTIATFECGGRLPSRDSAIALALALRRKLDWLLLGKGRRKETGSVPGRCPVSGSGPPRTPFDGVRVQPAG